MADDREEENKRINVVVKTSKSKETIETEPASTILQVFFYFNKEKNYMVRTDIIRLFSVQRTRIGQVQRAGFPVVFDIRRSNFERWRHTGVLL